jgi:alpha-glucosidase (family GH31 glycosyl hydrolase)
VGVNDQYLLGPKYLVAPVTTQNATSRSVVFPKGASWKNIFNQTDIVTGGVTMQVKAPLEIIPVFERV